MLFSHPEFDNHEHLSFFCDPETGLKAIVAIHNTSRGPALGGWPSPTWIWVAASP
jgi:leucine dehydrogenase